jgi:hypothetical protein
MARDRTMVERPMTMLNAWSVGAAVAAADTEPHKTSARAVTTRRPFFLLLIGLLVAVGASALALPASASNTPVGPGAMGSSSGGRMVSVTTSGRRTQSVVALHRMHMRRFHHHDHDLFADGSFPFGFGWPASEPDFSAAADEANPGDWHRPPYWFRFDRYEPPTVEKSPSGVTIIRGPGSHHGISP